MLGLQLWRRKKRLNGAEGSFEMGSSTCIICGPRSRSGNYTLQVIYSLATPKSTVQILADAGTILWEEQPAARSNPEGTGTRSARVACAGSRMV